MRAYPAKVEKVSVDVLARGQLFEEIHGHLGAPESDRGRRGFVAAMCASPRRRLVTNSKTGRALASVAKSSSFEHVSAGQRLG